MCLFCKHKYKIIEKIDVYDNDEESYYLKTGIKIKPLILFRKLVLQCDKCGKIKTKRV